MLQCVCRSARLPVCHANHNGHAMLNHLCAFDCSVTAEAIAQLANWRHGVMFNNYLISVQPDALLAAGGHHLDGLPLRHAFYEPRFCISISDSELEELTYHLFPQMRSFNKQASQVCECSRQDLGKVWFVCITAASPLLLPSVAAPMLRTQGRSTAIPQEFWISHVISGSRSCSRHA